MNRTSKLDQIDLLILYNLQQDGRMSLSKLGEIVDLTPASISYRLEKLKKNGVIERFTIDVNNRILTPNYQTYLISINIPRSEIATFVLILHSTNLVKTVLEIASSYSIQIITRPMSSADLHNLVGLLDRPQIREYQIKPILDDHSAKTNDLVTENISQIYCPLCQKSVSGEGIITEINNQTLSFCCTSCLEQFRSSFMQTIEE